MVQKPHNKSVQKYLEAGGRVTRVTCQPQPENTRRVESRGLQGDYCRLGSGTYSSAGGIGVLGDLEQLTG